MSNIKIFHFSKYIIYFFIADLISSFLIFRTAIAIITSALFYINLILVICISLMYNIFFYSIEREIQTPIYQLYFSILKRKNLNENQKQELFEKVVKHKRKIYSEISNQSILD